MTTKICIVFLSALSIGVLSAPSTNILVSNGFIISCKNDTLVCDKLTCPATAERCVITSKTDETKENIYTIWRCIGANDLILIEEQSTDKNPDINAAVDVHLESGRNSEASWKETSDKIEQEFVELQNFLDNFWKNFNPFGNINNPNQ